jgi:hypothetical protein
MCTHVCVCVYVILCIVHAFVCAHAHARACVYLCVCVCVCVCMCLCLRAHHRSIVQRNDLLLLFLVLLLFLLLGLSNSRVLSWGIHPMYASNLFRMATDWQLISTDWESKKAGQMNTVKRTRDTNRGLT